MLLFCRYNNQLLNRLHKLPWERNVTVCVIYCMVGRTCIYVPYSWVEGIFCCTQTYYKIDICIETGKCPQFKQIYTDPQAATVQPTAHVNLSMLLFCRYNNQLFNRLHTIPLISLHELLAELWQLVLSVE
jgi:hypothetical protein